MNAYPLSFAPAAIAGKIAAAGLAALALAGCVHQSTAARYDRVYPITAQVAPYLMELPAETAVSGFDARRIDAFGRDFLKSESASVTIAYPSDVEAGQVVAEAMARLKGVGVENAQILRGPYSREDEGDRGVVLSYYAPAAAATPCPAHPYDSTGDSGNQTPARFGCAYQTNIAAMLEEPRDAAAPRPATPPSADRRFHVLTRYAGGKKTASETSAARTTTTGD